MPFLRENNGRWSPEKIVAFIAAILPILWLAGRALTNDLGARPVTEAIHFTGEWAVRLLLLSLAITPARRLFNAPKLINMRRTLGVAACLYALFHFTLYIADQKFDLAKVASEIVLRIYLTIGFVALIGLIALGATSFDAAIRKLGGRWSTLHRATYVIAILAVIHFTLQKKLEIYEPILMTGFLMWLFGYRLLHRWTGNVTLPWLAGLSVVTALLTAALEAGWYVGKTGVMVSRVLAANFEVYFDDLTTIRPAWWVLAAGLLLALAYLAAGWLRPRPAPRLRPAQ